MGEGGGSAQRGPGGGSNGRIEESFAEEIGDVRGPLDEQHFETGGVAAGDSGGRILEHQGAGDAEAAGGQEIGIGSGLVTLDVVTTDDRIEVGAKASGEQERLDFGSGAGGDHGQAEALVKAREQVREGRVEGRVRDHLAAEALLFGRVQVPEVAPVAGRVSLGRHDA